MDILKRKRVRLTAEQSQSLRSEYLAGDDVPTLVARYRCSSQTVWRMLKDEWRASKKPDAVPKTSPQEPKVGPVAQATPPVMSFEERKRAIIEKFDLMVERTDQPENFEIRELLEAKGVPQAKWPPDRRARLTLLSNQFKGSINKWL